MNEYYFRETLYDLSILNEDDTQNAGRGEVDDAIAATTPSTENGDKVSTEVTKTETKETSNKTNINSLKELAASNDIDSLSKKFIILSCLSKDAWNKAKDKGDFEKDDIEKVNKIISSTDTTNTSIDSSIDSSVDLPTNTAEDAKVAKDTLSKLLDTVKKVTQTTTTTTTTTTEYQK